MYRSIGSLTCPPGQVEVNGVCAIDLDEEEEFETCPQGTFWNGLMCITGCPEGYTLISNDGLKYTCSQCADPNEELENFPEGWKCVSKGGGGGGKGGGYVPPLTTPPDNSSKASSTMVVAGVAALGVGVLLAHLMSKG